MLKEMIFYTNYSPKPILLHLIRAYFLKIFHVHFCCCLCWVCFGCSGGETGAVVFDGRGDEGVEVDVVLEFAVCETAGALGW